MLLGEMLVLGSVKKVKALRYVMIVWCGYEQWKKDSRPVEEIL